MTEFTNPVWGTEGDNPVFHGTEAPAADYPFHPKSACGNATITSDRVAWADIARDVEVCKSCRHIIRGEEDAPKSTRAQAATEARTVEDAPAS